MSITASISKPYAMKGAHRLEYCQFIQPAWKSNLTALSKMASVLCMVDCTLLPVITLLLPLIGLAGGDETWLHDLGHLMALYFVLPVGAMTTVMNIHNNGNLHDIHYAILGLLLVYVANSHDLELPDILHDFMHHGTIGHRLTNITGCALLLFSNNRVGIQCNIPSCFVVHEKNSDTRKNKSSSFV